MTGVQTCALPILSGFLSLGITFADSGVSVPFVLSGNFAFEQITLVDPNPSDTIPAPKAIRVAVSREVLSAHPAPSCAGGIVVNRLKLGMSGEGSKESMRQSSVKDENEDVRRYWNQEACGTARPIVGEVPELSREWFERIESYRYELEPFIHAFAQFTRHRGKRMLEIGVGAGTDHLQWARAGLDCHGVDLTERAIEVTRARLALYGLTSHLQRIDAETLPFPDQSFDLIVAFEVIEHLHDPRALLAPVHLDPLLFADQREALVGEPALRRRGGGGRGRGPLGRGEGGRRRGGGRVGGRRPRRGVAGGEEERGGREEERSGRAHDGVDKHRSRRRQGERRNIRTTPRMRRSGEAPASNAALARARAPRSRRSRGQDPAAPLARNSLGRGGERWISKRGIVR